MRRLATTILALALGFSPAVAGSHRHHPHPRQSPPVAQAAPTPPPDDLYRRRGYGQGGPIFGLGRGGDLAQAGACAGLAFADPPGCGAKGGYGIYGNGLGQRFGF